MGLFDKMFGHGAEAATQEPNAETRFTELKKKYETVLTTADQQHIQFQNLHVQDNKLFVKGTAPTEEAKNKFWDQVKLISPTQDDITVELSVDSSRAQGAAVGGGNGGQTYTVKPGDTLSKISRQLYGDSNEYMRIFYANRSTLNDPDKIQAGQQLTIPAKS
ncbi:MAG TPA: LysM peptidoglycan-binding domain-containing protein [Pyrinomonadaceae bacterium]|jgi:LysM repeat protein|nr:LysM peptidoglycan-binding domain-containing protein [Pyrinomonadaceae bacterium]